MNPRDENRFRRMLVGQCELMGLLHRVIERDRSKVPTYFVPLDFFPDLPADVVVDSVHYSPCHRAFAIIIASAEFGQVPCGAEIPVLEGSEERRAISTDAAIAEQIAGIPEGPRDEAALSAAREIALIDRAARAPEDVLQKALECANGGDSDDALELLAELPE